MESNHLSEDRMRQFMLNTLELTEHESEHINEWRCAECAEMMRKVVEEPSDTGSTPPVP